MIKRIGWYGMTAAATAVSVGCVAETQPQTLGNAWLLGPNICSQMDGDAVRSLLGRANWPEIMPSSPMTDQAGGCAWSGHNGLNGTRLVLMIWPGAGGDRRAEEWHSLEFGDARLHIAPQQPLQLEAAWSVDGFHALLVYSEDGTRWSREDPEGAKIEKFEAIARDFHAEIETSLASPP